MTNYINLETHIINIFNNSNSITWKDKTYDEFYACKPTTSRGECKTDVYVSLRKENVEIDSIKISIKKKDAEFIGNKLTKVDAHNLLGDDWKHIIMKSIQPIKDKFLEKKIFFLKPKSNPTEICFTLGWKLEIANKSRTLSAPLMLSKKEITDKVFRGTEQPDCRKHAFVNEVRIPDSGIADYLLAGDIDDFPTVSSVLNSLTNLRTYCPEDIYLIFTANNFRLMTNKADGPRTLAVCIKWEMNGENISPKFDFVNPLAFKGQTDMLPLLKNSLEKIGINNEIHLDKSLDIESLYNLINKRINL